MALGDLVGEDNLERYGVLCLVGGGLAKLISIIILLVKFKHGSFERDPGDTEKTVAELCFDSDGDIEIWDYLRSRQLDAVKAVDIFLSANPNDKKFTCTSDQDFSYIVPMIMFSTVLTWFSLRVMVYYMSRSDAPNPLGCGSEARCGAGGTMVKKYIKFFCNLPLNPIMVLNNNIIFDEETQMYIAHSTFFDTQFISVVLFGSLALFIGIIIFTGVMYTGLETIDRLCCNNEKVDMVVLKSIGYCFLLLGLLLFSLFGISAGFIEAQAFAVELNKFKTLFSTFFAFPQGPYFPDINPNLNFFIGSISTFNFTASFFIIVNFLIEGFSFFKMCYEKYKGLDIDPLIEQHTDDAEADMLGVLGQELEREPEYKVRKDSEDEEG